MTLRIGLLHPGQMGASVGQALLASGHEVHWVGEGRSEDTRARANGFCDHASTASLVDSVEAIVAICPPSAAVSQALEIADAGFEGVYVDANAVAPETAKKIEQYFGAHYVDGGIVGPPSLKEGTTRLYLSGAQATNVAVWFGAGHITAIPLEGEATAASALKMAYAAYTKGAAALLLSTSALAERLGVREALESEWNRSQPALLGQSRAVARGVSPKAWRFAGEMEEIAGTYREADLPDGFHLAAAEFYQRMAALKHETNVDLASVLQAILEPNS